MVKQTSNATPDRETIFALASGKGRAGVAVIRISGPSAGACVTTLTGGSLPEARRASLRKLYHPGSGDLLDQALVLWLPGPDSFTGEDVAELHVHGASAVVAAVYNALGVVGSVIGSAPGSALAGVRVAEPGEFSLRAFHHGRMDLTEAEGLNDLVSAETEVQRKQALRQLGGELGAQYESWRERLVEALAHLEATIDFSDEELPEGVIDSATAAVSDVRSEIDRHLADNHRGERIRSGFEIVILGAPNVGKSSLLNALAKEDVAIVSDIAGTTRDVVQVRLDLGGYMVELADTAGLRDTEGAVEAEGVRRALGRAENAAMKLVVVSAEHADVATGSLPEGLHQHLGPDTLVVLNKCDLIDRRDGGSVDPLAAFDDSWHQISALTGNGVSELLNILEREVVARLDCDGAPSLTRARHRLLLAECRDALGALEAEKGASLELVAENLRIGVRALGRITGRVDVESVLDVVFSDFCIGK